MLTVLSPPSVIQDDFLDGCIVWEWSVKFHVEHTNFREFYRSVGSPTRVTIHVEIRRVIADATVVSRCFPLEFTNIEAAFFQLAKDSLRMLDTSCSHLQALRVHVAPFRPLTLPLGKLVLRPPPTLVCRAPAQVCTLGCARGCTLHDRFESRSTHFLQSKCPRAR